MNIDGCAEALACVMRTKKLPSFYWEWMQSIEASLNDGIRCFVHFSNDLCSSFFLGADPVFTK